MKSIVTACTRDCPGACSIIAHVENGEIVKLQGNKDHEFTSGFLCSNMRNYLENRFYSSKRILYPLKKENGSWKRISWDEALDMAAGKLKKAKDKHGSLSIFYYQGLGARTALRILNKRLFNLFGGVTSLYGTVCGGIGQAGQELDFGERISHDPLDHLNSRVIIIWGRNPVVTDVHLWKIIRKARKKGAKIVVIDPVKTDTANRADIFFQPVPGSDSYFALALSKILLNENLIDHDFIKNYTEGFEEYRKIITSYDLEYLALKCDITTEEIEKLARIFSEGPISIILGWGVHRYRKGHQTFRMIDALAAISGNIGVSGGGVTQGFEEFGFFDNSLEGVEFAEKTRKLPMPTVGEAILNAQDPSINVIFITAGNPVAMNPNSLKIKKAFDNVDYIIAVDHVLNDTTEMADLFLPSTTFLEDKDLLGSYGSNWLSPINPVLEPLGESKSELEIFQALADRLGVGDEMAGSPEYWLAKLAAPVIDQGFSLEELQKTPVRVPSTSKTPYVSKKFKTASSKFEFIKEFAEEFGFDRDFPFRLLSIMPKNWVGSEIPEEEDESGILEVQVNPEVLKNEDVIDGEEVLLESPVGRLIVRINANDDVRKDIILTYRGGWLKYNKCVNVLTVDMISELGNGTPYHETFVRIKKV